MKYEVIGGSLPVLKVFLNKGESVYNDKGSMIWRTQNIVMETNTKGGFLKGFTRSFSGDNFFLNTFTSHADNQEVAFATSMPGCIKMIELDGNKTIIAQKGAFLMGEESVNLDVTFTKRFSSGLLGGEGFVLQKISGTGICALEIDGMLEEKTLAPGEVLYVDQGNIAYFDESVSYEIETVKGLKNKLFSGEGFFIVKLVGPGNVALQSLPLSSLAASIQKYIPTSSK